MNKTNTRLMEIAGHLDAITEQMKTDSNIPMKSILMGFYADEHKNLRKR